MQSIEDLKNTNGELDTQAIKKIIPYDEHFLMIDHVSSLDKKRIIATKKVVGNEDYLKGHFVGFPIMPGALIVEGMGQAGTLLLRYNIENHHEKEILAYKFSKAKFSLPTLPGDTVRFEIDLKRMNDRGAVLKAKAFNGDQLITEAKFTLAIVNRERFRKKFSRSTAQEEKKEESVATEQREKVAPQQSSTSTDTSSIAEETTETK